MYRDDSLTLHTDAYQINMIYTYWQQSIDQTPVVFEAYFRKMPFDNGYVIFAGLERIVTILKQLTFSQSDINYLRSLDLYDDAFSLLSFANLKSSVINSTCRSGSPPVTVMPPSL